MYACIATCMYPREFQTTGYFGCFCQQADAEATSTCTSKKVFLLLNSGCYINMSNSRYMIIALSSKHVRTMTHNTEHVPNTDHGL